MSFDNLNSDNVLLFCVKAYDRPDMLMSEFKEDMKRFNYLKRLFRRHRKIGELREQLVLNHLIVIYNVFGPEFATRILFFKMAKEDYSALKTYLLFLNYMPIVVYGIKGQDILSSDIEVDMEIAEALRKIK
jgi:hypothetical protein